MLLSHITRVLFKAKNTAPDLINIAIARFCSPSKTYLYLSLLSCLAIHAKADEANSEPFNNETLNYLHFLKAYNSLGPLDTAGSLGSLGFIVGLEFTQLSNNEHNSQIENNFSSKPGNHSTSEISTPKISLKKGLFYPLDLGVSYLKSPQGGEQFSAYGQWNLYEAFALPAIAARFEYNALFGLKKTKLKSWSAASVVSWGYSYFALFAEMKYSRHEGFYTEDQIKNRILASTSSRTIGLQTLLHPTNLQINIGSSMSSDWEPFHRVKISYLF